MTATLMRASHALLQGPATDTVMVLVAPTQLEIVADVALVALTVTLFLILLVSIWILVKVGGTGKSVRALIDKTNDGLAPVLERSRSIAENLEFISHSVRNDITRLNESVGKLGARLDQASDHMEERIEDFNALMEVVQEEAEGLFIDTATTVRAVRAGAQSITGDLPRGSEATDAEPESTGTAASDGATGDPRADEDRGDSSDDVAD